MVQHTENNIFYFKFNTASLTQTVQTDMNDHEVTLTKWSTYLTDIRNGKTVKMYNAWCATVTFVHKKKRRMWKVVKKKNNDKIHISVRTQWRSVKSYRQGNIKERIQTLGGDQSKAKKKMILNEERKLKKRKREKKKSPNCLQVQIQSVHTCQHSIKTCGRFPLLGWLFGLVGY